MSRTSMSEPFVRAGVVAVLASAQWLTLVISFSYCSSLVHFTSANPAHSEASGELSSCERSST